MVKTIIYHNPRCSKSRQALEILRKHGIEPEIVEYLKTPLSQKQVKELLTLLKVKPTEIIRNTEPEYKALGLSKESTDSELIKAIANEPILLQRPIVVHKHKAAIGRPPENILEILK